MGWAQIKKHNGQNTIFIDGKPYGPMAVTLQKCEECAPEQLRYHAESNMKIFFLEANTKWVEPGREYQDETGNWIHEPSATEHFRHSAERLLEYIPDAYIMVRIMLHPSVEWHNEHPEELMQYQDGSHKPYCHKTQLEGKRRWVEAPGMYSMASELWRQEGKNYLEEFYREVDQMPFADRIIGYFLGAGGSHEWYPLNPLEDWENGLYGDFSPAFQREYSRYLRQKYHTEEALRQAWNMAEASFEHPYIPTLEERKYVYHHEIIMHPEPAAYQTPREKLKGSLGVFLDANHYSCVADFYHAWHHATANSIIYFARVIKQLDKGKLVGAFYGSYGCSDFYPASTAEATLPILDSGVVDFLAAPGVYNNRQPGGYVAQREMQDSFLLRNEIFVTEDDSRTHLGDDTCKDCNQLYDIHDTLHTLKRDFARDICEGTFAWWYDYSIYDPDSKDMKRVSGNYQDPEIAKLFKRQQEISSKSLNFNLQKKNEIALIYDQESVHYVSALTDVQMLDYYRSTDLMRIGAPVDYYFHNDMANPEMPDYKMYLMINLFCLTDEERLQIQQKAARNGATVVWLYAPGFINPDHTVKMDNQYITELTGFRVGRIDRTSSPRFKIVPNHPALRYADPARRYGYLDRELYSNVWVGSTFTAPYVDPCFYIEDPDAEVLGTYLVDGRTALAMKPYKGFTSVYCGPQVLRSELLASLAEYSGCHLFMHGDDVLFANENFVTVHASSSGIKTVYFKKACSPFEVYERKFYGKNVTSIQVPMQEGDTLMFCISQDMPAEGI